METSFPSPICTPLSSPLKTSAVRTLSSIKLFSHISLRKKYFPVWFSIPTWVEEKANFRPFWKKLGKILFHRTFSFWLIWLRNFACHWHLITWLFAATCYLMRPHFSMALLPKSYWTLCRKRIDRSKKLVSRAQMDSKRVSVKHTTAKNYFIITEERTSRRSCIVNSKVWIDWVQADAKLITILKFKTH